MRTDPFGEGLAELEFLLEDAGAAWWRARLQPIRSALAALDESDENAAKLRHHASDLMDQYPRPEMVPEVLVELLQLLERNH